MSAGVIVEAKSETEKSLKTIIADNLVRFQHTSGPSWSTVDLTTLYFHGISYRDTGGFGNATAVIQNNTLESEKVNPLGGIWLRDKAHDVVVLGNDMRNFTASSAQIRVDTGVHDCVFTLNSYGKLEELPLASAKVQPVAALLCYGGWNCFLDSDFSSFSAEGAICIQLDSSSSNNLLVVDAENFPSVQNKQWTDPDSSQWKDLNQSTDPSIRNRLVVLRNYPKLFRSNVGQFLRLEQQWSLWQIEPPMFEPPNPVALNRNIVRFWRRALLTSSSGKESPPAMMGG